MRWAVALLALLLAGPAYAGRDDDLVPMWIKPGALQHSIDGQCGGTPKPGDRGGLPAGLRVTGKPLELCGQWMRVVVSLGSGGVQRLITSADSVTTKPPRSNPWKGAEAIGTGWVRSGIWGRPLDRPTWETPIPLRDGESVELLEKNDYWVVRTTDGSVLAVRYGAVELERDPTVQGSYGADRKASRERWEAGRKARATSSDPIGPIPTSDELLDRSKELTGRLYVVELERDWMSDEVYDDAWVDPVEQTLRRTCREGSRRDADEACGTYVVDYRPIGAYWPGNRTVVLVEFTGTKKVAGKATPVLRVLVVEPMKVSGPVGPAWAEGG